MRLTIDTAHDSKEDIKKMVNFLNTLISSENVVTNMTTEQQESVTAGLGSMFGEQAPAVETAEDDIGIEQLEEEKPQPMSAKRIKNNDDDEGTVVKFKDLMTY